MAGLRSCDNGGFVLTRNPGDSRAVDGKIADITVVIATHNRADRLAETLTYLLDTQVCKSWNILVINNGSTDRTEEVLREMGSHNPLIQSLHEQIAGKSHALNLALRNVRSKFIVFTDDDVRPVRHWLTEIRRGLCEKGCGAACGPIIPEMPECAPSWMRTHPYSGFAFGHFNPDVPEGPLPPYMFPFGANFGVRADAVATLRFREDLGRTHEHPWRMCADTDFVQRLRAQCGGITFMPQAAVSHHIPLSSVRKGWIFDRAFHLGRSFTIMEPRVICFHPGTQAADKEVLEFEVGVQLNFYCGALRQLQQDGRRDLMDTVLRFISRLPLPVSSQLLGDSAKTWLADIPV
jgi:GT2 family glycosyltransferase